MNKKSNNATKIFIEVLHDFFKDINTQNVNDELNDIFDTTNNTSNHMLNDVITKEEIEKAISNLKNDKACAEDAIVNTSNTPRIKCKTF